MLVSLAAVVRLAHRRSVQRVKATVQRKNTANGCPQLGQLKVDRLGSVGGPRIARAPNSRNLWGSAGMLAETARFELAVAVTRHDGLANRWFQPLTHVSGAWQRRGYSERVGVAQQPCLASVTTFGRRIDSPRRGSLAARGAKDSSGLRIFSIGWKREVVMAVNLFTRIVAGLGALSLAMAPAMANDIRSVDPSASYAAAPAAPAAPVEVDINSDLAPTTPQTASEAVPDASATAVDVASAQAAKGQTYKRDDLIGAAEGVFGKGAKGLAELVEKILKDQGEPNAYIAGREASGAFVVGLRYGSGTLSHSIEGQRAVYWTGPSLGFDVGGDAANTFVLVYNLYDSQDLYKRYPQVEGRAYFVGGLSATYLRRGNVAIIPIRLGVGLRLGANIGYMKFSEKSKWLPF